MQFAEKPLQGRPKTHFMPDSLAFSVKICYTYTRMLHAHILNKEMRN